MPDRTEELLAQIVDLLGRQLAAQQSSIEYQRLALERQRFVLRRVMPAFLIAVLLFGYGPYYFQLLRNYFQR